MSEFGSVTLGDARLKRRLESIVVQVARSPGQSFPSVMTSTAEREALYRFLGNDAVAFTELIAGHVGETVRRASALQEIRVVHDTTTFSYDGEREGLGIVEGRINGFYGHFAIGVGPGEQRQPLGVLGVLPYIHRETKKRRGKTKAEQVAYSRTLPRSQKESSRWETLARRVAEPLSGVVNAIHVMDQEADDFALMAELAKSHLRFVIRGKGARLTALAGESVRDTVSARRGALFRTVHLNRRPLAKQQHGRHPARGERSAKLSIRWAPVTLRRPQYGQTDAPYLELNVIHVFEQRPPKGEAAVEWFLFTQERVESLEDAAQIVDHYRARWVIEEYFKALKTGCAIEKRQLCSYDALLRALGLFVPIAWRLLALRHLARHAEPELAETVLGEDGVEILRVVLSQRRKDYKLAERPTVRDAMLAIAAVGGHIRNNGDPGWLVLGRGFQAYVEAEAIWRALRCDQS